MTMKTKIATIVTLATLIAGNAYAQIFTMVDETDLREEMNEEFGVVPGFGLTNDQNMEGYTPLGSGILVLAALSGAYLLTKRKNKNE